MSDDELRKLAEMATPGPWAVGSVRGWDAVVEENYRNSAICQLNLNHPSNAAFIAAARNEVPRLLDENAKLRKALGQIVDRTIEWIYEIADAALRDANGEGK